jgi:phage-related protein
MLFMLDETFYIDGIDARTIGIFLQKPIEFSAPVPIVEKVSVPGRNGNLVYETGAYENRTAKAVCYCIDTDEVEMKIRAANKFLFSKSGYRRLETSDDPYHFWLARVSSGARLEQRMGRLAPFEISFDCKPQRFLKSGEVEISFSNSEMEEGAYIYNQTGFNAKPIIEVSNSGAGILEVGNYTVEIGDSAGSPVYLDCESQNAYAGYRNLNMHIKSLEFPVLVPGENTISVSGLLGAVTVIPRWWEL